MSPGLLASASRTAVCIWDVNSESKTRDIHQKLKFENAHGTHDINDARFSPLNHHLLVTSGSDGHFKVWDLRDNGYKSSLSVQASDNELNVCTFNNLNPYLVATGGDSDGSIAIWDLRKASALLNDLEFHKQ